ncbi:MAG: cupin domain-containing protein [Burkholderiales bacterium]|nr:cupin domain-containing protein [Burkholderiales bacterium]
MVWKVRRVVTGHNKEGKSIFLMDGLAPNVKEMATIPGLALTDLWESRQAPDSNAGDRDNAARPVRLEPPKGGSILRIVEFPPDSAWRSTVDAKTSFESIGAGHAKDAGHADPMMHTTATVDYIIVLKGEIHAVMETGETLLKAGDILIQRGTNHSWSVRGNEPCIIAAVLISAKPLGLAAKVARAKAKKRPARAAKAPAKKAAARKPAAKKSARKPAAAKGPAKKAAPRKSARGR